MFPHGADATYAIVVAPPPYPDTVAAVDLGSNSFHLIVARPVGGEIHVIDRLRERVALAEGLDERKRLTREARQRALSCLELFGQRLRHMPHGSVRAVGTNTLRQARNGRAFLGQAEQRLGHPVEVISGREEARLVYLGVSHTIEVQEGRRLVVDIGGGSTECIIGEGFEPLEADSLYMGCVSFSRRFFPDGVISSDAMDAAQLAASLEVQSIAQRFKRVGWTGVAGSSGTIRAVESILRAQGLSDDGITEKGLRKLRKAMIAVGHADKLAFDGMPSDRAPVLAGGVAIVLALFEMLGIERMATSSGALREGLLYDLLGRMQQKDVRERTIRLFSARHHVDMDQAERVAATALRMLAQVAESWDLEGATHQKLLGWAARLHEVGISVSHSGYHKHGAYLLEHSDMPGFSREEQVKLAALVLCHRRKLRKSVFGALPEGDALPTLRLCLLLRLAVRLDRGRSEESVPEVRLEARKKALELTFPAGWLEAHPLTVADLGEEAATLEAAGYRLRFG